MPSLALTVILNYNQSKKFALLLDFSPESSILEVILREARNKFRDKKLTVVFLLGGTPFEHDADLAQYKNRVFVSRGEPYSGPPHDAPSPALNSEIRIIDGKSFIEDSAIKQLKAICALPGVQLGVGMPDLHPGSRFPIGCAIACDGIYPALIGSDVGCGIALYRLSAPSKRLLDPVRLAGLLRGLDNPWHGSVSSWLVKYGIERSSSFDSSLGTVGAGNHFAEICTPEKLDDPTIAAQLGIVEGGLYLLVHTGSRGLGASILDAQTTESANPYLQSGSEDLYAYLVDHDYAVQWAVANRDLVAHRISQCLEGHPDHEDPEESPSSASKASKILDVTHNSVTSHAIDIAGDQRALFVHRKGSAPADRGVVPCPGSRGDFSWLLIPTGDGQKNAFSLAHGAGRRYSRKALHNQGRSKTGLTTTMLGSEVVCTNADLLVEERPEAYKNVQNVVEDMEHHGICRGAIVLRPVVTYKVREGG